MRRVVAERRRRVPDRGLRRERLGRRSHVVSCSGSKLEGSAEMRHGLSERVQSERAISLPDVGRRGVPARRESPDPQRRVLGAAIEQHGHAEQPRLAGAALGGHGATPT